MNPIMPTAAQIMSLAAASNDESIKKYTQTLLQNSNFDKDPIYFMATRMIARGTGLYSPMDPVRVFIITQIPNFKQTLIIRLQDIAERRFADKPNKKEILGVFKESMNCNRFKRALESLPYAASADSTEERLRNLLEIYTLAEQLKTYDSFTEDTRE